MNVLRSPRLIVGTVVALALMAASRIYFPVVMPHITLAPEKLAVLGPLPLTNTMVALLVSEVILIVAAFLATRRMQVVPSGLQNFFEAVIEFWDNQSQQLVGPELARRWLPLVATVFLVIWFSNYLHFIPGFDSVGMLCEPGHCPGEYTAEAAEHLTEATVIEDHGVKHVTFDVHWTGGQEGSGVGLIEGESEHGEDGDGHGGLVFVPFLRVAASDLNFTIALALIAFVAVEVVGFRRWGPRYLTKFFHVDFRHGIGMGLLNMFVGLIELISELARIVSFAFRLFGNIFAGAVLMLVFMFLVPFILVVPIFGLELFVGVIQAFVFAILILAFITLAVAPLHGDDH